MIRSPEAHRSDPAWKGWQIWICWTAILTPLPYSISRVLWAIGIPLGFSEAQLRSYDIPGWGSLTVLGLAALCEVTAVFVHVFVLRGTRALPSWIPIIGGRPVRPGVVIGLLTVPVVILAYANAITAAVLLGVVTVPEDSASQGGWAGAWLTGLVFGVWGAALTASVVLYYRRTRTRED
jgi:hypothetical protein